jgi:hypothetical protein
LANRQNRTGPVFQVFAKKTGWLAAGFVNPEQETFPCWHFTDLIFQDNMHKQLTKLHDPFSNQSVNYIIYSKGILKK